MASQSFNPAVPMKREWGTALRALRRLLANGDDTVQVFRIMRALNGDTSHRNYRRLIASAEGGRLAYERVELAPRLCDRAWIDTFAEGSVGAAYRAFLDRTGYSADGLAELSIAETEIPANMEHPYAWFGRRERDIHDLWHVLTATRRTSRSARLPGRLLLRPDRGLGWALIGAGAALKTFESPATPPSRGRCGRLAARPEGRVAAP